MKTKITLLITLLLAISLFSQDIITKKNGEKIKAKISEINSDKVIFNYENETLTNKISINEIAQIKFESGRIQIFKNLSAIESPYKFDILEPKYIGNIYQIDENGNILNTLEQQKSSSKSSLNASALLIGIGKAKSKNVVKGKSSPIRVKKGKIVFIAKVDNSKINPKEIFNIFPLEIKKKKRFIEVAQANTFGLSKAMDIDFIPFKAYPYKDSSFIIELTIEKIGEYAITIDTSRNTFNMFGVDN